MYSPFFEELLLLLTFIMTHDKSNTLLPLSKAILARNNLLPVDNIYWSHKTTNLQLNYKQNTENEQEPFVLTTNKCSIKCFSYFFTSLLTVES